MNIQRFQDFLIPFIGLVLLVIVMDSKADTVIVPYVSLGAHHRDCAITDQMLCKNPEAGSDTPGTIDMGLKLVPMQSRFYFLWADEIDIGWHHQSYVDRGYLIPFAPKKPGGESQIDMYGIRWTWTFKSLSFVMGI